MLKMRFRSNISIILIALFYITLNIGLKLWKDPQKIIANDVIDYYAYLPALVIYNDISLNFKEDNGDFFAGKIWGFKQENGKYVLKMSGGLAIMYSPFFFMSHLYALSSAFPADGYSIPYGVGILIGSLFYFIAGLFILKKLLRNYFSEFTVTTVLLLIALATNVSNYIIREPGMSHTFSFFLFSAFLLLNQRWHQKQNFKNSLLIGLVVGLISLVRPTNSIIILIFIFWNVFNIKTLKDKVLLLLSQWKWILVICVFAMMIWIPQLAYWKYVTGSWFHYSYNQEGFYFLKPKIFSVLIGFRKGWLIYTPVMFFALLGFYRLFKTHKQFFWGLSLFTIVNIYIISSWWCWWFGGSYGHRAMIESYAIMSIPLGAFIQHVGRNFKLRKTVIVLSTLFFIAFNLFQNYKYIYDSIHYDSMTKLAWVETITKLKPTQLFYDLLIEPDYESALAGKKEQYSNDTYIISELFSQNHSVSDANKTTGITSQLTIYKHDIKNHSYLLNNNQIFSPEYTCSLKELNDQHVKWIIAEIYYKPDLPLENNTLAIVVSFESKNEIQLYFTGSINSENLSETEWKHRICMIPVPLRKTDTDIFKCYIWNIDGKAKGIIDDFRILKVI